MIYPFCPLCQVRMVEYIVDGKIKSLECKRCFSNWYKPYKKDPKITVQFFFSFKNDEKKIFSYLDNENFYRIYSGGKFIGKIPCVPLFINDDLPKEAEKLADKIIKISSFL